MELSCQLLYWIPSHPSLTHTPQLHPKQLLMDTISSPMTSLPLQLLVRKIPVSPQECYFLCSHHEWRKGQLLSVHTAISLFLSSLPSETHSTESLCTHPLPAVSHYLPGPFLTGSHLSAALSHCIFNFASLPVPSFLPRLKKPHSLHLSLLFSPGQLCLWIILYIHCFDLLTSCRVVPSKVICDLHTVKFEGYFSLFSLFDPMTLLT